MAISLITSADPFQQRRFSIGLNDLSSYMKANIILNGSITIPYSSIFRSEITFAAVKEAKLLLESGQIKPDIRDGFDSYRKLITSRQQDFDNIPHCIEVASFLDDVVKERIPFKAKDLSIDFASNVKNGLALLQRYRIIRIQEHKLTDLMGTIGDKGISQEVLVLKLEKIGAGSQAAIDLAEFFYHLMGALVTESVPSWPAKFNKIFYSLKGYQEQFARIKRLEKKEEYFYRKNGLLLPRDYESISSHIDGGATVNVDFSELPDVLMLSKKRIGQLRWQSVRDISLSSEARKLQQILGEYQNVFSEEASIILKPIHLGDDRTVAAIGDLENIINEAMFKDLHKEKRISMASLLIGISSLVCGAATLVVNPLLGTLLTVGGLSLSVGQYMADIHKKKRFGYISSLGQKIMREFNRNSRN